MKKQNKKRYLSNIVSISLSLAMLLGGLLPVLFAPSTAYGATVTSRSIKMSTSSPTAAASSVTYTVSFTTATTGVIQGLVVDFCSNGPLIGTTCTAPTGFSVGTPTVTNITGLSGTWTAGSLNTGRTLTLTNSSGASVNAGTAVSFEITTVTNPTTVGTFYGRILTYATTTGATGYVAGTEGAYTDDGGVALSTAYSITINATVQEALAFCLYVSSACATSNVAVNLGNNVNGLYVIDSAAVYANTVQFQLGTNAAHGVAVNLYGGTLTSGSNTIPDVKTVTGTATASAITKGTAEFGLYLSSLGTNVAAISPYSSSATGCASGPCYYLDTSTAGTTAAFGQPIAQMSGPTSSTITTITYGVTASNTTAPGVYTATHQLTATATF
jgi:hypothetical protein